MDRRRPALGAAVGLALAAAGHVTWGITLTRFAGPIPVIAMFLAAAGLVVASVGALRMEARVAPRALLAGGLALVAVIRLYLWVRRGFLSLTVESVGSIGFTAGLALAAFLATRPDRRESLRGAGLGLAVAAGAGALFLVMDLLEPEAGFLVGSALAIPGVALASARFLDMAAAVDAEEAAAAQRAAGATGVQSGTLGDAARSETATRSSSGGAPTIE